MMATAITKIAIDTAMVAYTFPPYRSKKPCIAPVMPFDIGSMEDLLSWEEI